MLMRIETAQDNIPTSQISNRSQICFVGWELREFLLSRKMSWGLLRHSSALCEQHIAAVLSWPGCRLMNEPWKLLFTCEESFFPSPVGSRNSYTSIKSGSETNVVLDAKYSYKQSHKTRPCEFSLLHQNVQILHNFMYSSTRISGFIFI